MRLVIDILHPAHLNLFKSLITTLHSKGNTPLVICIDRGTLSSIVIKELGYQIPVHVIGKHSNTFYSIIFQANILRFFSILKFIFLHKIDVGLSFGSFILGAALKIRNVPNIHFSDDPERKVNAILENLTCVERYLPPIIVPKGKVKTFNALKEWAYLSPKYFNPNEAVLNDYNIKKKEYFFVREVSTGSLNYLNQEKNIIASIAKELPDKYSVILSLEDKKTLKQYPDNWILLREPVDDIHSLMYFCKYLISSGDSMAREGAMLGVPSIYCGFREMKANKLLIDRGMLFKILPNEVSNFIAALENNMIEYPEQLTFRSILLNEWVDVTNFILERMNHYQRDIK